MESTFASRVRQYRQEKDLSQKALADRCGLTQGNIAHMESGIEPKQSNVSKLINGLPDLNPDWLLLGTGTMLRDGRPLTPADQVVSPPHVKRETLVPVADEEGVTMWVHLPTPEELLKENHELRRSNAIKDGRIAALEENQTWLRQEVSRKPNASSDAADLYAEVNNLTNELRIHYATAEAPNYQRFVPAPVVRQMSIGFGRQA